MNIFDPWFNGIPHSEMYRSWVLPELHPDEPQPQIHRWHPEDLQMFVGGSRAVYAGAVR